MPDEQMCRRFGPGVKVHEALPGQTHKLLMLLTCRLIPICHRTPIEPRNFKRGFKRCIAKAKVPEITV